eukprot:TRINITY_DN5055_c0_g1_i1.p1 TRINITY_DN5055_c0_g1~~TRINITY_DN5055_c0_g1_i1.p1  ORF type:complete len:520 (-),score=167.39 TRINITY_DN5055_c0_g1_i1:146-1705(-)
MGIPELSSTASYAAAVASGEYDATVVVCGPDGVPEGAPVFGAAVASAAKVDKSVGKKGAVFLCADASAACGGRLIVSGTGPLGRDFDDVRRVADAAAAGASRAKASGASKLLFVLSGVPSDGEYEKSSEVALLGALAALYRPLQGREGSEDDIEPVKKIGVLSEDESKGAELVRTVSAMEEGRRLARDLGGSDPERMSPVKCAEYIAASMTDSGVEVEIVDDVSVIEKEYPLAHAVARASLHVPRHHPRIVRLHWKGAGEIKKTLMFSGKGIVYDTGGADIKVGGSMAGMSKDKCGACNIAGFVKSVSLLKPEGLEVFAELGFVRNSAGSDAYVADESIRGHAGKRVFVLNTDAEGRMVLSDCLSHLRERALRDSLPNVQMFTMATLTGHAVRSVGPYVATMDNGPARAVRHSFRLQDAGHLYGDPLEVSTMRREDYEALECKTTRADILQLGGPKRGHQFAGAFLSAASGVDQHGRDSDRPLAYTHLDIAGAAAEDMDYKFGHATACCVVSLSALYGM